MKLHQKYLLRLAARLVLIVPFAALVYDPSPGFAAPIPILGDAQGFAVLGSSLVSNVLTNPAAGETIITGDLGISPNNAAGVTGFPPGIVNGTQHLNDGPAIAALAAVTAARTGLGALAPTFPALSGDLGAGRVLIPGVYEAAAAAAVLNGTLSLNAQGEPNAVWVFHLFALTTGPSSVVELINPGGGEGIFWVIDSSAVLDVGTTFIGNLLPLTSISLLPGAQITCGRAMVQTAAVTFAGFGGPVPPEGRNNAVSIGCEGTAGEDDSDTDASGFSGGVGFDEAGNVVFISGPGPGPGPGTVPAPASFLLLAAGLIGVAARVRRARAR